MKKLCCLLVLASVAIQSCKKNNSDDQPSCDSERSRPVTKTTTTQAATTTTTYRYDANGRSTQFQYLAPDTAFEKIDIGYAFYYFNSNGDQVQTSQYNDSARKNGPVAEFFYQYDQDHRLAKKYGYSYNPKALIDSVAFIWQDGNLIEERDLTGFGNSAFHEYYPGSNGASLYNVPLQASRWLYNPSARPVLSKNFVTKTTTKSSTGITINTITNKVSFDTKGRIKMIDNDQSRQVITYECY